MHILFKCTMNILKYSGERRAACLTVKCVNSRHSGGSDLHTMCSFLELWDGTCQSIPSQATEGARRGSRRYTFNAFTVVLKYSPCFAAREASDKNVLKTQYYPQFRVHETEPKTCCSCHSTNTLHNANTNSAGRKCVWKKNKMRPCVFPLILSLLSVCV